MTSEAYDIVIIGGGHNGLVCAFYCARAGLKVLVLERRAIVGGAAVTEEFAPGFRNSTASYTVSLLHPKIIGEMALPAHGLSIIQRRMQNFLPLNEREYLAVGRGRTKGEVAKFSRADAGRLDAFNARLGALADAVRELLLVTPPKVIEAGSTNAIPELLKAGGVARRLSRLDTVAKRDLLALFGQSAGEWLDGWFESDPVKAAYGFDAIVGNYASPYSAGTGYVLLHHGIGEVNGIKGAWGHAIGGMGAITKAMAAACKDAGVDIRTGAEVREVIIEQGRAVGVTTAAGDTVRARAVAANVNPKLLYLSLIDTSLLPADFVERMRRYRCASGTFRMNVALGELPRFSCLPEPGDHLTAGIIIAPSLGYMDRAYSDARATGWSKTPIVEILVPSFVDQSLAPEGKHVASLFCQHTAPALPDGSSWDAHRDEVADLMIDTVDRYAPGFKASVSARSVLTPLDLERIFGLVGGDIMHGSLALDQLFSARPVLGYGNYRGPIPGLYMCGAGTHPGGGVSGIPGHNAAREIVHDVPRRSSADTIANVFPVSR